MILTLIPIRPFYQTSAGMASVGDGRLRMRRPASLSTVSLQAIYGTRYTETRAGWGSVGDGRLGMRPKVTLSQKKNQDVGDRSGRGASKNHYYHGIYRF